MDTNLSNNRNQSKISLCFIMLMLGISAFFVILFAFSSNINSNNFNSSDLYMQSVISIVIFVWALLSWYFITKTLFSPFIIFLCTFYFFQSGLAFLYVFGADKATLGVFASSRINEVVEAQLFSNLSLIAFMIAAIVICISRQNKENVIKKKLDPEYVKRLEKSMGTIGTILLAITIIPAMYFAFNAAIFSSNVGYGDMFDASNELTNSNFIIRMFQSISTFFLPSLILLMFANKNNLLKCRVFAFILLFRAFLVLIGGSRSSAAIYVILLVWFWNTFINPFSKRQKIYMFIILIGLFTLMPVFAAFRGMSNKNFSMFGEVLSEEYSKNPLVGFIAGLGYSIQPLILTMRYVPLYRPFGLGASLFYAIPSIIPKAFLFGLDFSKQTNLAEWLSYDMLHQNWGTGFSMNAEAYYNFGWPGLFLLFFWGLLIAKIFYYTNSDKKHIFNNPLKNFFLVMVLSSIMTAPRSQFIMSLRSVVYMAIICFVIYSTTPKNDIRKGSI